MPPAMRAMTKMICDPARPCTIAPAKNSIAASRHAAETIDRELTGLIDSEVDRLAGLLDRLMSPAPPRPHEPLNIHAVLERVFLPLVSGRAEGSGLGLALAQQVAREHRGSLAYRSRPGHTVFTLLLPMPLPLPEEAP